MKYILSAITIFLISNNSFSQWQSESTNDPFDGKQTTVIATGNGGSFPYEKPMLVFRNRSEKLEVFISNAGTVINKSKLIVSFGDPNSILEFNINPSTDNSAGFFILENENEILKLKSLVDEFKRGSKSFIRLVTDYGNNSWNLSLSGSTRNLNEIFDENYWKENHPNLPDSKYLVFQNKGVNKLKEFLNNNNYNLKFRLIVEYKIKSLILKNGEIYKLSHKFLGDEIEILVHFKDSVINIGKWGLIL